MEKKSSIYNYIRNLLAVVGILSLGYFAYSFLYLPTIKECNYAGAGSLTRNQAITYLNNYATKFQAPKRGYFISRAVITRLLCDSKYNGIYVYPGLKNTNNPASLCIISEAGTSTKTLVNRESNTNPVFYSNENLCPEDCGSF